jgi:hypothetical protein
MGSELYILINLTEHHRGSAASLSRVIYSAMSLKPEQVPELYAS